MSPSPAVENVLDVSGNPFNISVRKFANVASDNSLIAGDTNENLCETVSKAMIESNDVGYLVGDEIVAKQDDDETDEPVSPPTCGEACQPNEIFCDHNDAKYKGMFEATTKKLLSLTPVQRQNILHLNSKLRLLNPSKLQELNTALQNHIRKSEDQKALETLAVESLLSLQTGQFHDKYSEEKLNEKQISPISELIPLTISSINETPIPARALSLKIYPTLHMSGGGLVKSETEGKEICCRQRSNILTKKDKTARKQKATHQSTEPFKLLTTAYSTFFSSICDDQLMKRKTDGLPEESCRKKSKMDETFKIKEFFDYTTKADTVVPEGGHSTTKWTNSTCKTGKTKLNSSKSPLPGLEQFLLDLLHDPRSNPQIISWEGGDEEIFRITNLRAFFKVWRHMKKVPISYDLLKKSIKLSEESDILLKIPKTRCVYKFGKNSKNWRPRKEEEETTESLQSFQTYDCKLKFSGQDTEKVVLNIDKKCCVDLNKKLFLNIK